MRWLRFTVLILIATLLQASLIDRVTFSSIRPDLLLVLLAFFAIYANSFNAIITSFTIGFAADLIASSMGPHIISFGLLGVLLANMHRVIAIRKLPYQAAAIFVLGILTGALTALLTFLQTRAPSAGLFAAIFGTAVYSALVGPFLFLPSAWWVRIKTKRFSKL